jgi:hypothetical protein
MCHSDRTLEKDYSTNGVIIRPPRPEVFPVPPLFRGILAWLRAILRTGVAAAGQAASLVGFP